MKPASKFSIISFGDRWDEYERRNCSIMSRLASYDNVEHILIMDMPLTITSLIKYFLGSANDSAKQGWDRVFKHGLIYKKGKIYVLSLLWPIPFYGNKVIKKVNIFLFNLVQSLLISRYIKRLNIKEFLLWFSGPVSMSEYFARKYIDSFVCYDLCEDYVAKYNPKTAMHELVSENDAYLTKRAGVIFVATKVLFNQKKAINGNVFLVTNGVDPETFDKIKTDTSIPKDLRCIPRPILMNVGVLNYRTDCDAISTIANQRKDWSIVHIGPQQKRLPALKRLKNIDNIYFLGPKPAKTIPFYLAHADICMLAYKMDYQNRAGSSMKLLLYLASGKPIISFTAGGADDFHSVVNLVNSTGEFVEMIGQVLENETPDMVKKRLAIAKENSWEKKAEQIHSALCSVRCRGEDNERISG